MSFRDGRLAAFRPPGSTVWLLTDIAEEKGRQDLYKRQAPQALKALQQAAIVSSTESSNRIEGVVVDADRLRPLVLGSARPLNRPEEEIQNYRKALSLVHARHARLDITVDLCRRLHRTIQEGSGDAGQFKRHDNVITERRPGEAPSVRFRPVAARETPAAMKELCRLYQQALEVEHVHPLVADSCFVLDFLCIHPFRDGNGRVSRLLTLLAAYRHGLEVGRFISLERLIEESKDDYYDTLRRSSEGWHAGRHDIVPWLNHSLAVLRRAYGLFKERVGDLQAARGSKTAMIDAAIAAFDGPFTLSALEAACPGVSRDMIRRLLWERRREGRVVCLGRGPKAKWKRM
jgi:Fic family protein